MLSDTLFSTAPSAGSLWELQRRLTSQLGLHALLTHTLALRAATPHAIILRRDLGSADLLDFGHESLGGGVPGGGGGADVGDTDGAALFGLAPFRLTRGLQHLISPLGIAGPFAGAICAAAECLANSAKCPLPLWMDLLARPEEHAAVDGAAAGLADGLVPWCASGEAAASRMRLLSPVLLTRGAANKTAEVDVHAKVHALVEAATSMDNLCAMPSAFQAWI